MKLTVFAASIFLAFAAKAIALDLNQNRCDSTDVCFLQLIDQPHDIYCNCTISSAQCWWTKFANPEHAISTNGITESLLMLQRDDYGQYICYGDNSTIARDILILPEGRHKHVATYVAT